MQEKMASFKLRLDRGLKTTALRSLRLNLRAKRLFTKRKNCLFITCFPKSGSTFLVSALAECSGYTRQFLGFDQLNEQDLYLPNLIDSYNMNIVCHQHTRATLPNLKLIKEFGIRPVVLVRNIFDCLISLRDHLERESSQTPVFSATDKFFSKSQTDQLDELIDIALPWYVNFVMSWKSAQSEGVNPLWLTYEDMMVDKPGTVRKILEFYDFDHMGSDIDAAVSDVNARTNTRFNRGVIGRGRLLLSAEQQRRVMDRFQHYSDVDFSMIGIAPVPNTMA
tara:strand:+ start:307 stop:1143 length:837 start_codon:yes stop_codon:yes gene_type:complete